MESNIDMAQHSIINLKKPEDHQATYAANVKFVADAIVDNNTVLETQIVRKITESFDIENVFKKVIDDDEFKEDDSDIHKSGVQYLALVFVFLNLVIFCNRLFRGCML